MIDGYVHQWGSGYYNGCLFLFMWSFVGKLFVYENDVENLW